MQYICDGACKPRMCRTMYQLFISGFDLGCYQVQNRTLEVQ